MRRIGVSDEHHTIAHVVEQGQRAGERTKPGVGGDQLHLTLPATLRLLTADGPLVADHPGLLIAWCLHAAGHTALFHEQAVGIGLLRRAVRDEDVKDEQGGFAHSERGGRVAVAGDVAARAARLVARPGNQGCPCSKEGHFRTRMINDMQGARVWRQPRIDDADEVGALNAAIHALARTGKLLMLQSRLAVIDTGAFTTGLDECTVAIGVLFRVFGDAHGDFDIGPFAGIERDRIIRRTHDVTAGAARLRAAPGEGAIRPGAVIVADEDNTGADIIRDARPSGIGRTAGVGDAEQIAADDAALDEIAFAAAAQFLRHQPRLGNRHAGTIAHKAVLTDDHAVVEGSKRRIGGNARAQPQPGRGQQIEPQASLRLTANAAARSAGLCAGEADGAFQQRLEGDTRRRLVPDHQRTGKDTGTPVDNADFIIAQPVAAFRITLTDKAALVGHGEGRLPRRRPARRWREVAGHGRGRAVAIDVHIADMPDIAHVAELAVIIHENRCKGRLVPRPRHVQRIALQAMHGIGPRGQHHGIVAQVVACAP